MESPMEVEEGGTQTVILALDTKSVKPYATQDEYLYAMKEDLAEWFNTLYGLDITVDNFFEQLESGVTMCQHANNVTSFIKEQLGSAQSSSAPKRPPVHLPDRGVQYRSNVKEGSFQARDNVSNFIGWCKALGINNVILFETEDLVLRKNERHVVLCLLEVARRGAQYGMLAPTLVQMEREIDAEIAGQEPAEPVPQRKTCDLMSLDEMVREMVSLCTCPDQFPMVKVSDGKYRIGDSQTLIFVRILRNHVMVRIGGGWDTLENYLDRHDPCRCAARGECTHDSRGRCSHRGRPTALGKNSKNSNSKQSKGHKGRVAGITPTKSAVRRQSAPANQLVGLEQRMRPTTPSTDKNQKSDRAQTPSKQVGGGAARSKRSLSLAPQPSPSGEPQQWKQATPNKRSSGNATRSLDPSAMPSMRSPSPASSTSSEASRRPGVVSMSRDSGISGSTGSGRREVDSASDASSSCGGSPGLTKRFSSTSDLTFPKELTLSGTDEDTLPRMRPTSARDRARRVTASGIPTGPKGGRGGSTGTNNNNNNESSSGRGRQKQKSPVPVTPGRQIRSRSVEPMDLNIERVARKTPTIKSAGLGQKKQENEVLIISRDSGGRHRLAPQIMSPNNGDSDLDGYPSGSSRHSSTSSSMSGPTNGYSNGYTSSGEDKRPGTPRVKLSPDRILPDKPKLMSRSHTADLGHMGENSVTAGEDSTDTDTESRTHTVTRMSMSSNQSSTLSLASSFDDYPEAPPEDKNLNAEMERMFEQFRKQELSTKKKSSRSRHRRSNSADLLEMDGAMYDRQKINNAFQKARSSSRDMLDGPSSASRVRSRRSSTASVESNSSSTRQTASSTPRRTGTITPTPTRTSSLRGALGMARELRNKLSESSGGRQTPVRSSSMNTPRSTTPLVGSRTATSQAAAATRGRSQTRDEYRAGSTTGSRASSRAGSRNPSRDSSLTRERLRPSSAMSHREQQQKTGPRRPASARTTKSRSREDLLDGGSQRNASSSQTNGSGPAMNGRPRSQSITNLYPDCASPESTGLSPDGQLTCNTGLPLQLDIDREAHTPKPRKDKRDGRTRIPMPVDMLQNPKYEDGQPLRRYDSGVDINNMSPTESSVHGDDNWQQELILQPEQNALQLATQSLGYQVTSSRANGQSGYDDMF